MHTTLCRIIANLFIMDSYCGYDHKVSSSRHVGEKCNPFLGSSALSVICCVFDSQKMSIFIADSFFISKHIESKLSWWRFTRCWNVFSTLLNLHSRNKNFFAWVCRVLVFVKGWYYKSKSKIKLIKVFLDFFTKVSLKNSKFENG